MITNDFDSVANQNIDLLETTLDKKVIVQYTSRNARKGITTVRGLHLFDINPEDLKNIGKMLKKKHGCACTVREIKQTKNENLEQYMELQGNHTDNVKNFLLNELNIDPKDIMVKGI
jgi:translation initiation factor 1 (eIF-1/SUI1)